MSHDSCAWLSQIAYDGRHTLLTVRKLHRADQAADVLEVADGRARFEFKWWVAAACLCC